MPKFEAQICVRLTVPVGVTAPAPTVEIPHTDLRFSQLGTKEQQEVAEARKSAAIEAEKISGARTAVAQDAETSVVDAVKKALAKLGNITDVVVEEVREVAA